MSNKSISNIYNHFENRSDCSVQQHAKYILGDLSDSIVLDKSQSHLITHQIYRAISRLRAHGWLDIEEFRLPNQLIDTRALFFKLDELFEQMPRCISDQEELGTMQRMELRPLIEKAISVWQSRPVPIE